MIDDYNKFSMGPINETVTKPVPITFASNLKISHQLEDKLKETKEVSFHPHCIDFQHIENELKTEFIHLLSQIERWGLKN